MDGNDVTPYIRTPRISRGSSDIAVIPEVRMKLVEIQRNVTKKYDNSDGRKGYWHICVARRGFQILSYGQREGACQTAVS